MIVKDTLNNAYFLKSYLKSFYANGNVVVKNALFANCKVMAVTLSGNNSTAQFVNSYVSVFSNDSNVSASFINCTIVSNPSYIYTSTLLNTIIVDNYGHSLRSSNIANNCVAVGYQYTFQNIVAGGNNKSAEKTIFIDSDPLKDLTEEAKKLYIGSDGTQVGMYGGTLPFNTTPSYPQITKMNVAQKTTADGKLSVEIEVSAAQ